MNDEDLKKIGDQLVKALDPVYEEFDKVNGKLGEIDGELEKIHLVLEEHTDKLDALTVEVHEVHQELGIFKDEVNSEIDKIKVHIGLPSTPVGS